MYMSSICQELGLPSNCQSGKLILNPSNWKLSTYGVATGQTNSFTGIVSEIPSPVISGNSSSNQIVLLPPQAVNFPTQYLPQYNLNISNGKVFVTSNVQTSSNGLSTVIKPFNYTNITQPVTGYVQNSNGTYKQVIVQNTPKGVKSYVVVSPTTEVIDWFGGIPQDFTNFFNWFKKDLGGLEKDLTGGLFSFLKDLETAGWYILYGIIIIVIAYIIYLAVKPKSPISSEANAI